MLQITTLAKDMNCVLLINFPTISSSYFLLHRCTEKSTGKIIHIILCIFIHSSFCVLNLFFPARRPNFSEAARTTQNLRSAGLDREVIVLRNSRIRGSKRTNPRGFPRRRI